MQLLDLSRNQLNGIEDTQAAMLQKIKEVRLENNPLICDRCHMGSLIQIAKNVSSQKNCLSLSVGFLIFISIFHVEIFVYSMVAFMKYFFIFLFT